METGSPCGRAAAAAAGMGVLLVATLTGLGCASEQAGGQTGDEDGLPPANPPVVQLGIPAAQSNSACAASDAPAVLASLDDGRAGFSARDVLAFAEGAFDLPITWHRQPHDAWEPARTIVPSGESDTMQLTIAHMDGDVRHVQGAMGLCNRLEVDVEVTLKTDSGALNESSKGVLRAWGPHQARLVLRFHSQQVKIEAPTGSYDGPPSPAPVPLAGELAITAEDETRLAMVEIGLNTSALGVNGVIDAWLYATQGNEVMRIQRAAGVATIGEPCGSSLISTINTHGYGLPGDASPFGTLPSAMVVIDQVDGVHAQAIQDDGTRQELVLGVELDEATTCAHPDDGALGLVSEGTLRIEAGLGRGQIDGRWPVRIAAGLSEEHGLEHVRINLRGDVSLENVHSTWGITGIDLAGYDLVELTLQLELDMTPNTPAIEGDLFLRGSVRPSQDAAPIASGSGDLLGHIRFE